MIKSIETTYIKENVFKSFLPMDNFEPYYHCVVISTWGMSHGNGETKQAAEENAIANLKSMVASTVDLALEEYNVSQGAGMLDIA